MSVTTISSVLGKNWHSLVLNEARILQLKQQLQISDLLAQILSNKDFSAETAPDFLEAKIKNLLSDPFHLKDMDTAVAKVISAIKLKQKICIFADYDVDGATSSALLKNIFRDLKIDVAIYVPDRIKEGYGPSIGAMEEIKDQGFDLVITVDCGAAAKIVLMHALDIGLQVIVIDHHLSIDSFPSAIPVVNPNRIDETSPYTYIAAVGVAFLFAVALVSTLKKDNYFSELMPPDLMKYLDLVAIGTVCDVMPLIGLNRAFVQQGIRIIKQRKNLGLRILCEVINITDIISCYHLGFIIGPRINAGGRVGRANFGAELLSTEDEFKAKEWAMALDQYNQERRAIEEIVLAEAFTIAEAKPDDALLFIVGRKWHQGVIGIVAGRIKDKYNKPVAVIAVENGIGKASCRSVKGINFGAKITEAKNQSLVISGGGHAMAAGFTVEEDKIAELEQFLLEQFKKDADLIPSVSNRYYDCELTTLSLNQELTEVLEALEPFGQGNFEPVFKILNLYVLKANIVGTRHISCVLAPNANAYKSKTIRAIAFNSIDNEIGQALLSKKPLNISVIGNIRINIWNNKPNFQLFIQDIIVEG